MIFELACLACLLTTSACSSKKVISQAEDDNAAEAIVAEEPSVGVSLDGDKPIIMRRGLNGLEQPIASVVPTASPKGFLYKTSGAYLDNVPIQLSADGLQLISFPAPTDIPLTAEPVELADGWLLSPVGITPSSVFTRWTYAEYRALPQAPTPEEVLAAVIPGAKVTMTMPLPMTTQEAMADTTAVNDYIRANRLMLNPSAD